MKVKLGQSKPCGEINVPPSKSYTIRGLILAALAQGESCIASPLICDDTLATRTVLKELGVRIKDSENSWQIMGGRLHLPSRPLHCHESAATLRFVAALCATLPGRSRLIMGPTLCLRPHTALLQALEELGATCHQEHNTIIINGTEPSGGTVTLPGDISSQFISALIMVAPRAKTPLTICLSSPLHSRPYVDMTIECMRQFGVSVSVSPHYDRFQVIPQEYHGSLFTVEGDWSSASYLLALGTISGPVTVWGLNPYTLQADRKMLDFLQEMGAKVFTQTDRFTVTGQSLRPIEADLEDAIDLLPTLTALASLASGRSVFGGVSRARLKESDRIQSLIEELGKMQVTLTSERDKLVVYGGAPKGAELSSHNDHRIAMSLSLPGLAVGNTLIHQAECVRKTYPSYWDDLVKLGGRVIQYEC